MLEILEGDLLGVVLGEKQYSQGCAKDRARKDNRAVIGILPIKPFFFTRVITLFLGVVLVPLLFEGIGLAFRPFAARTALRFARRNLLLGHRRWLICTM